MFRFPRFHPILSTLLRVKDTEGVDIDRGRCNEGNDEANSSGKKARDHKDSEPTDVKTIVS